MKRQLKNCGNCKELGEQVVYDFHRCNACSTILTQKDRDRRFCESWDKAENND